MMRRKLDAGMCMICVLSAHLTATGALQEPFAIDFDGFEGSGEIGKVEVLYAGDLPPGEWVISGLIQGGVTQDLGGVNYDETIVDNAIVLEANGELYGLNHRYDGLDVYGGVPYTNQVISGSIEIAVWESTGTGATAAAAGSIYLESAYPSLGSYTVGDTIVLFWAAGSQHYTVKCSAELYPASWSTPSGETEVVGDYCYFARPADSSQCFFRLLRE